MMKTFGGAQGLFENVFTSPLGTFKLCYPGYDVHSCLSRQRIEGTGVTGVPARAAQASDGDLDPEVVQAMEWGLPTQ